ncbi:unnamed protein product [Cuscuta epithymum]|uniref:Secreted protein n=1 Tax=Cuscuta epithymum TaxID=186058 RepID=A0AAV0CES6_9ASTE|nr:unnamed protein product [Cuscuta epithymum]
MPFVALGRRTQSITVAVAIGNWCRYFAGLLTFWSFRTFSKKNTFGSSGVQGVGRRCFHASADLVANCWCEEDARGDSYREEDCGQNLPKLWRLAFVLSAGAEKKNETSS